MKKLFAFLQSLFKKEKLVPSQQVKNPGNFISLSPIDNADDNDGKYSQALLWALQNRRLNKNIAITGPHGSGKSSLIKTFETNNVNPDLVFLNISLATFEEGERIGEDKEKLLRLIELSILQQMFYHEEDADIPDTRFKKTRSLSHRTVRSLGAFIFFYLLAFVLLFQPNLINTLLKVELPEWANIAVHYFSLAMVVFGSFFLILKSVRPLRSIQLKKFNFQDVEFGVDENISKSILNEHLDEILYFFEVTPYTVVVIEDLDRFKQTEIFTKLRELNHLINYSKKIKRDVSFVYAVRDDMFKDKERAKFFDFILPVIPVINSANSEAKLTRLSEQMNIGISGGLIDNISLFIDDMRLMYNVLNEYQVYRSKVNPKGLDNLFAIIVYKNIYPNDFVGLSEGRGELFNAIGKKAELTKEQEQNLRVRIPLLKQQIQAIEDIRITDVFDLRKLYIWQYISSNSAFANFYYNGQEYSLHEMLEDEKFGLLEKNDSNLLFHLFQGNYGGKVTRKHSKKFSDVEKEVDPNFTYEERLTQVNDFHEGRVQSLKVEIQTIEDKITKLRKATFSELMADGTLIISVADKRQNQIINILLRYGYIDENYFDYISVFHEGALTKSDQEFLLNVRAHLHTSFEHQLTKIDKLVSKITITEFEQPFVYNINLLDHLLDRSSYTKERDALLKSLSNESDISLDFINEFITTGRNTGLFVKHLAKQWKQWWKYIIAKSSYTEERQEEYFKLIMQHADLADIVALNIDNELSEYIASYADFATAATDTTKLEKVVERLGIKFIELNLDSTPKEFVVFVNKGNHYLLSTDMLSTLLKGLGVYDKAAFENRNYTNIQDFGTTEMVAYVEQNIGEYVEDVLLKTAMNDEKEDYIVKLLNNENLTLEQKWSIIQRNVNRLNDISKLNDNEVVATLLDENKLTPSWNNIITYFHRKDDIFDEHVVSFLNAKENCDQLAADKIDVTNPVVELDVVKKFVRSLMHLNDLNDEIYSSYVSKLPYYYTTDIGVAEISGEKVEILIKKKVIRLSEEVYDGLREHFTGLHIIVAEHDRESFIKELDKYTVDAYDAECFMESSVFTVSQKNTIINSVEEGVIIESKELLNALAVLMLHHSDFKLSKSLTIEVIQHSSKPDEKVKLLLNNNEHFTDSDLMSLLANFPDPYDKIVNKGKKPLLKPAIDYNIQLATMLFNRRCISKYNIEKKGVRIITFRS